MRTTEALRQRIRELKKKDPELTNRIIAERTGTTHRVVEGALRGTGLVVKPKPAGKRGVLMRAILAKRGKKK